MKKSSGDSVSAVTRMDSELLYFVPQSFVAENILAAAVLHHERVPGRHASELGDPDDGVPGCQSRPEPFLKSNNIRLFEYIWALTEMQFLDDST